MRRRRRTRRSPPRSRQNPQEILYTVQSRFQSAQADSAEEEAVVPVPRLPRLLLRANPSLSQNQKRLLRRMSRLQEMWSSTNSPTSAPKRQVATNGLNS